VVLRRKKTNQAAQEKEGERKKKVGDRENMRSGRARTLSKTHPHNGTKIQSTNNKESHTLGTTNCRNKAIY
jgi:hypothetical protein